MKSKYKMAVYNKNYFKIREVRNIMELKLTEEEAILLKNLLSEELYTIEDMASTADEADKKELEAQLDVMKTILAKLQ